MFRDKADKWVAAAALTAGLLVWAGSILLAVAAAC